jgi:sulfotransferase family protein
VTPPRIRVVYIAGFGRSGSTLLGNMLGSIPGFFSTGELHMLSRALVRGSGCGCGRRVDDCEVWSAVLRQLRQRGGWPADPDLVHRWQLAEARVVHTPRLLRQHGIPSGRPVLDRYASFLSDLYASIVRVTGASVVVDSSKTPADAAVLRLINGVDPYVVHLVRDPRAVARSQRTARPTLDTFRADEDMHRRGAVASSVRWVSINRLTDRVRAAVGPHRSTMVRYEDFAHAPERVVRAIVSSIGEDAALPFTEPSVVRLGPTHTVWGNRSRFLEGDVRIRPDEAWRGEAPMLRASVTALTAPWLRRYGYALR